MIIDDPLNIWLLSSGLTALDTPYEVNITIPVESYDPIQFTLTKVCSKFYRTSLCIAVCLCFIMYMYFSLHNDICESLCIKFIRLNNYLASSMFFNYQIPPPILQSLFQDFSSNSKLAWKILSSFIFVHENWGQIIFSYYFFKWKTSQCTVDLYLIFWNLNYLESQKE